MNEVFWANARAISNERECNQKSYDKRYPRCKRDNGVCIRGCRYGDLIGKIYHTGDGTANTGLDTQGEENA